jgi:hypothetical protein
MVQVDFLLAKIQVRASLKYSMALVGLTLSRHAAYVPKRETPKWQVAPTLSQQ